MEIFAKKPLTIFANREKVFKKTLGLPVSRRIVPSLFDVKLVVPFSKRSHMTGRKVEKEHASLRYCKVD